VTDYGLEILTEVLKLNKTVEKIDLNSNHITDLGINHLGMTLKVNNRLKLVKLSFNSLKDKSCEFLF
jgi:hypothetical protein